jgi:Contractile injection system tube protein
MTNLAKAKLIAAPGEVAGVRSIEFLFNPTQLAFEGVVETSDNPGTHSEKSGKPKVSFSNIQAYKVTISNILFDTYESNDGADRNVVAKYIDRFKEAVKFVEGKERPPIYTFSWGDQIYLKYCFVERVTYKLTMFLPNGVPVRAVIDNLTLKETDGIPSESSQMPAAQESRSDTMAARRGGNQRG